MFADPKRRLAQESFCFFLCIELIFNNTQHLSPFIKTPIISVIIITLVTSLSKQWVNHKNIWIGFGLLQAITVVLHFNTTNTTEFLSLYICLIYTLYTILEKPKDFLKININYLLAITIGCTLLQKINSSYFYGDYYFNTATLNQENTGFSIINPLKKFIFINALKINYLLSTLELVAFCFILFTKKYHKITWIILTIILILYSIVYRDVLWIYLFYQLIWIWTQENRPSENIKRIQDVIGILLLSISLSSHVLVD